jgi:glycosyltransferase involved in cell wall biosynthesis
MLFLFNLLLTLPHLKKYDLIHVIEPTVFPLAFIVNKFFAIPLVFTTHGPSMIREFPLFSLRGLYTTFVEDFFQKGFMSIAKVVTMSREVQKRVKGRYGISPEVIYHGVNSNFFSRDRNIRKHVRASLKLEEEEFLILFVGYLWKHKDILTLINAIPKVLKEKKEIRFLIIGRGPQFKEMMIRIKTLRVEDFVIIKEYVEDIISYYNAADLFVFPAIKEEFGLVYVEAMAQGLPIIAVNRHVVPEIVGDAALTFEPGNSDELAYKILQLTNNKLLYNKLREKGLEKAKKFTWQRAAEEYYRIYKEVTKK